MPINQKGEEQAKRLKPFFEAITIDHAITSPLKRCVKTASFAGFATNVQQEPDIMEWNYGAYEGRTHEEIWKEKPDWNIFLDGAEQGESVEDVLLRGKRVITSCLQLEGNVLLFSHGHFCRVLAALWLELPLEKARNFALFNARVCVLGLHEAKPMIFHWNVTP